jgi:predicted MFS family arabinose efflux permease
MSQTVIASAAESTASELPMRTSPSDQVGGIRLAALLLTLFAVSTFCQIDRILPFIMAEKIKSDLSLSDTHIGLITGIAFAACFALLSLPLARASDRGSPRLVLVSCIMVWSLMTALGGYAGGFFTLAATRFGVALGEAGATPSAHALMARRVRLEHRGLAIGVFSMGIPLGTMVGFAVGGALADTVGWRLTLIGAGAIGATIGLLAFVVAGPTPPIASDPRERAPFWQASLRLLSSPRFRWLFVATVILGFAAAPFYAFAAPFLIREHGFSTAEAGLTFGLLQGLMGIVGTVVGGRGFDREVRSGGQRLLSPPGILFVIASATTAAALFVPNGRLAVALFVPGMLSFSFALPWSFGSGHLVAGKGNEALASSLGMIGGGLLGPALGPLIVGLISDAASASQIPNGLGLGLLIVPVASLLTGVTYLIANRHVADHVRHSAQNTPSERDDGHH